MSTLDPSVHPTLTSRRKRGRFDGWYRVSIDSARFWLALVILAGLGFGAYRGYEHWSRYWIEQQAYAWVSRSESLLAQLDSEPLAFGEREELRRSERFLGEARSALAEDRFRAAAESGREAYDSLLGVAESQRRRGTIAWFRSVQGDVHYRRGERNEFLRAYPRLELQDGDYVMSGGSGSAEIHFRHEDAVFTLRPGSLIKISRTLEGSVPTLGVVEYGWGLLDTSGTGGRLRSRDTELQVSRNSRAALEHESGDERTRISVSEGRATATALSTGETRTLERLQQVDQTPQGFGRTIRLPGAPELTRPDDGLGVNIDATRQVELEWSQIEGAARYRLQVSRHRLFASSLIDARPRQATATLGLRQAGHLYWRVAAVDGRGNVGPWSEPRRIRVESYDSLALEADVEPPHIEVRILMSGNLALLSGKTEPGARLEVNGSAITVAADGSFSTTQTIYGTGRIGLDFRAVDGAGNDTVQRHWVFVDDA